MKAQVIFHADQSNGLLIVRESYAEEYFKDFPALMKLNALTEETGDPFPDNSLQVHEGVYFVECQTPGGSQGDLDDPLHAEIESPSVLPYDPLNNRYNQTSDPDAHKFSYDFSFAISEYERTGIIQIVVKVAVGGVTLTSNPPTTSSGWNPYLTGTHSLTAFSERHIARALTSIAAAGYDDLSVVMIYGQGEGDQVAVVQTYKDYFMLVHERIRVAFNVPVLPVVFRHPTISTGGGIQAQVEMTEEVEEFSGFNAAGKTTDQAYYVGYPVSPLDHIHWLPKACWNAGFQMSRIWDGYRYRFDNKIS